MDTAKVFSMDAAIATVSSKLGGIFGIEEEQEQH